MVERLANGKPVILEKTAEEIKEDFVSGLTAILEDKELVEKWYNLLHLTADKLGKTTLIFSGGEVVAMISRREKNEEILVAFKKVTVPIKKIIFRVE